MSDASGAPFNDILRQVRFMQFADSAFPVGSFAFSNGLESALQTGVVSDAKSLKDFVEIANRQAARMDGLALLHSHRAALTQDYDIILAADAELWCHRVGEEQQMMLARMGKKMAELALRIDEFPLLTRWLEDIRSERTAGCYPVGQAIALAQLGASEKETFTVHQYGVSSMILSAAVRLMRIDHFDTQRILYEVNARIADDYEAVCNLPLDEMESFAPVFDVLIGHHVTAHVRMFMN